MTLWLGMSVWGDQMVHIVSSVSTAAVMAQVKSAGDTVRSHQDCADLYSDMATVSSSAGKFESSLNMKNYQTILRFRSRESSVNTVTERLSMKC